MALDVGIVGLGWMGQDLANAVADLPNGRVSGGFDPDPDARSQFASTFDCPTYERLTELYTSSGLDGIMISSPHNSHYEHTAIAIKHGLDVLVEKPFVLDPKNGKSLVEAATAADCVLQVGYQRRFHPGFRTMRNRIETGAIGDLRMVVAHLGQEWYTPNRGSWRLDPDRAGGGILFDTGSHLLASLLWTADLTPRAVTATGLQTKEGVDIDVSLSIEFNHGNRPLVGSVGLCGESTDFYPDEVISMWGSHGRLRFEKEIRTDRPDERLLTVDGSGEASWESFQDVDHHKLTRRKVQNFLESMRGNESPRVDGRFALSVAALRQAAIESFETNVRVSLDSKQFTLG
jgi:predicted dehydrogenase